MPHSNATRMKHLQTANEVRLLRNNLKRDVRADRDTVQAIIARREELVIDYTIYDIIRIAKEDRRSHVRISDMNAAAVRDGINLLISLRRASERTRRWTINYLNAHPYVCHTQRRGVTYR